jgi:predicted transcriptional regulator
MSESLSIRLQPQTVDTIAKIADKRLDEGVKDSKARIVAEAVAKLAKDELNNERD